MKVIFLDIDGVLNHNNAREVVKGGIIGLNHECLLQLKRIVDCHNANIVLISTWKLFIKDNYDDCKPDGKYLIDKLSEYGMSLYDITDGPCGEGRGKGILDYLNTHTDIESYIIIDDEKFNDYDCPEIIERWVKPSFYAWGLTEELADKAIRLLE